LNLLRPVLGFYITWGARARETGDRIKVEGIRFKDEGSRNNEQGTGRRYKEQGAGRAAKAESIELRERGGGSADIFLGINGLPYMGTQTLKLHNTPSCFFAIKSFLQTARYDFD
jgi:hypothetical protein